MGGTKGKVLTTSVAQIYVDFGHAVEAVKNVNYDVMDLDAAGAFEDSYQTFRLAAGLATRNPHLRLGFWAILQLSAPAARCWVVPLSRSRLAGTGVVFGSKVVLRLSCA